MKKLGNTTILKVHRQDGKLIMEIEEEDIIFLADSFLDGELKITDKEKLLNYIVKQIPDFCHGMEDKPMMLELLDNLLLDAAESAMGLDLIEDREG